MNPGTKLKPVILMLIKNLEGCYFRCNQSNPLRTSDLSTSNHARIRTYPSIRLRFVNLGKILGI